MSEKLLMAENLLNFATVPESLRNVDKTEFTKAVLIYASSKYQLLPELADVLPIELLFKLLYAFSGQVLEIPDQSAIRNSIRDLNIFFSVSHSPTTEESQRLARQYETGVENIRRIVDKVAKTLERDNPLTTLKS